MKLTADETIVLMLIGASPHNVAHCLRPDLSEGLLEGDQEHLDRLGDDIKSVISKVLAEMGHPIYQRF